MHVDNAGARRRALHAIDRTEVGSNVRPAAANVLVRLAFEPMFAAVAVDFDHRAMFPTQML